MLDACHLGRGILRRMLVLTVEDDPAPAATGEPEQRICATRT
jgi:hypothetical protein